MRAAAFFDLDGTLINEKSMISFINFIDRKEKHSFIGLSEFRAALTKKMQAGVARSLLNREYYRIFSGISEEELNALADEWADEIIRDEKFYKKDVVDKLNQHAYNNDIIVLVTGSFDVLIEKITTDLPVHDVLCSTPELVNGVYTGELNGLPCIGEEKKSRILKYTINRNIDLSNSWAYGDDPSDIYMLDLVANGMLV